VIQSYGEDTAPSSSLPGFNAMTVVVGAACFFVDLLSNFAGNNGIITYFLGGYATSASDSP
jgi:hypothetical protein